MRGYIRLERIILKLKRDYIIKTYKKGKKNFYLSNILYAFLTSFIILLFINITVILKEGISNFNLKFMLLVSLGGIASFVIISSLFIPDKWNEIVKKYNNQKKLNL